MSALITPVLFCFFQSFQPIRRYFVFCVVKRKTQYARSSKAALSRDMGQSELKTLFLDILQLLQPQGMTNPAHTIQSARRTPVFCRLVCSPRTCPSPYTGLSPLLGPQPLRELRPSPNPATRKITLICPPLNLHVQPAQLCFPSSDTL